MPEPSLPPKAMRRADRLLLLAALAPLFILSIVVLSPPMSVHAEGDVGLVDQLTNEVMCQCGCAYTVNACAGAMQCDVSEQMRQLITTKVSQGQTRAQVIAYFTQQYGEKVLAAPTKQGFNLMAWVMPFAAIIAGAAAIYLLIQAWLRRKDEGGEDTAEGGPAVDLGVYGERVDRELEQFT